MAYKPTEHELANFWSKVRKGDDCWEWQGARTPFGHGVFSNKAGMKTAHRFSYLIHHGEMPQGMFVCHKCDNPACVNPAHLEIGDQFDNMGGCSKRGRIARGNRHPRSKLTDVKAKAILMLYRDGVGLMELTQMFRVSQNAIRQVVTGVTWHHATGLPKKRDKWNKTTQNYEKRQADHHPQ